jgi:predicted nucleic acid-binding protein
MSGPEFLASNVLVYAYDHADPSKQRTDRNLLFRASASDFVASPQVRSEFASTMLHKPRHAARPEAVVAAAERGGCVRIWSEDLNSGQSYFGVVVENPFK